ncbi:carboxypeptidase regulatory-like domain-containing protein [Brevifollis gellanilyticus]|nr:carboxypeptidase regulatory-like domain-containing protein [Brevifollis gellanilyticus]
MKAFLLFIAATFLVPSAYASFHLMQVEQIIGSVNGNTAAQAIQLRMRSGGQNLVSSTRVRAWDAAGANPVTVLDMGTNVSVASSGARILLATSAFITAVQAVTPGFTPDFTLATPIPAGYLAAGRLTFEDDGGTIYWMVAWGGASYTGSVTGTTTNDADGNFGPAFGQGLPTTGLKGLLFQGAASAPSTSNSADYALSAEPATVTKNSGASTPIGVVPTVDATLSPSTQVAGDIAPVVVSVTNLTPGGSAIVERFLDVDGDSTLDAGEFLIERFTVTDGQVTTIGGVRNTNIPGDEDLAANGQMTIHLRSASGPELGRGAGSQIVRVSSPTAAFTTINRTLTFTQPNHAQSISGTVRDGASNAVPFAFVVLLENSDDDAEFVQAVAANASGQYSINAPVGSYQVLAVKNGFVSDMGAAPTVALPAGATPTQNVTLTAATTSISGKVADAATSTGLPGVQLFAQSMTGLVTLLSTNANGNYSAQVVPGQWQLEAADASLSRLGYVIPDNEGHASADTSSAAATNVNINLNKATALIYGTVKDQSNTAVNGVQVEANDNDQMATGFGVSVAPNGSYAAGVLAGTWSVGVLPETLPAGYAGAGPGTEVTVIAGQALEANLVVSAVTAHLRGQIRDDTGAPIPNITLVLQKLPITPSGAGSSYPSTDANGNFDLGVYAGTWNIALECVESQEKSFVNVADLNFAVTDGVDQNGMVLTFPRSTFVITGTVKDTANNPIAGVQVDAGAVVGNIRYFPGCVATDANGAYTLRVLNASWEVSVRQDDLANHGYNPVESQNVVISGSNGVANFVATDSAAPSLDSSLPANGATGVVRDTTVKFTFSERMQTGVSIAWSPNVTANQFSFSWSVDGRTLTCTYSTSLPADATINWTLNPTAQAQNFKDVAGNALPSDVSGSFTTSSSLGVPEIAVEKGLTSIADAGSATFDATLVGGTQDVELTIKNTGPVNLQLTGTPKVAVSGADAARFTVIAQPVSPIAAGGSANFTVRFAPTSAGLKSAALSIANNDGDENPYNISLSGSGVAAVPPVVATVAASGLAVTGATLNGTVNAKGSARDVVFEYGLTTAYGTTVMATPGSVNGSAVQPVSAALTSLLPHTKYNFRVKASGVMGAANGANQIFTTLDTAPVAGTDNATALPGGTLTLDVLDNDTDGDADVLTLTVVTPPPAKAGGAKIVNGHIVFAAAAGFTGTSFTYTISDGFGKTAKGTVNVGLGDCELDPDSASVLAAATSYPVSVGTEEAWVVAEALPWVTVTPVSGTGPGEVTLTLQANAAKTSRRGVVTIGGRSHVILQAGILGFTLEEPENVPQGRVSADYELTIPASQPGVKFTLSSQPPGLSIHKDTGVISGKPKAAGTFNMSVTGLTTAGASTTLVVPVTILPLPAGAVGTFSGIIARQLDLDDNKGLGGRFEMTTSSAGGLTGKLIFATKSYPFPPNIVLQATLGNDMPTAAFTIARTAPLPALQVSFTIDSANNLVINGDIHDGNDHASFEAWRNIWAANPSALTPYLGLHTFVLHAPDGQPEVPQGSGIGSFTVAAKTGTLTAGGKLADGTTFACVTSAGPHGEVLIFQPLHGNKGSILGKLVITQGSAGFVPPFGNGTLAGTVSWLRPDIPGRLYPTKLGPYDLTAVGGRYVPPSPATSIVMGIVDDLSSNNAELVFSGADLGTMNPDIPFRLKQASGFVAPLAANNPAGTKVTVTPATGTFAGSFTLVQPNNIIGEARRPAAFQGQIVRDTDQALRGYGFFLLPDLPVSSGQTLTNTPLHSGLVEFFGSTP